MKKIILCLLLFLAAPLSYAMAEEAGTVFENIGLNGGVNWTNATISAKGMGFSRKKNVPDEMNEVYACRAAIVDGQRNLLEIIKGVRIEGETLVENFLFQNDKIKSTVKGVLKGAEVKSQEKTKKGGCKVIMEINMNGPFAKSIYEELTSSGDGASINKLKRFFALFSPQSAEAVENPTDEVWKNEIQRLEKRLEKLENFLKVNPEKAAGAIADNQPTGIVIDARGSNFIPSMFPRIHKLRGGVIYPQGKKTVEQRGGRLVSLFMNDLILAQKHPRIGSRPLVLKALKTYGNYRTEIVMGSNDAQKLIDLKEKGFLVDAEVIIVLD